MYGDRRVRPTFERLKLGLVEPKTEKLQTEIVGL